MNKGKVSDESLNLGGLADLLSVLLVFTVNDVLADIILLGEVEELADVGGSLGTKTAGLSRGGVGKSGNILLTLLDDHEVEDSKIGTDDAATDGLALTLTSTTSAVARVTVGEEEADTVVGEDTLLHGETLLVVSSSNTENVTLPLIAELVSGNFLGDSLIQEHVESGFIIIRNGLLSR